MNPATPDVPAPDAPAPDAPAPDVPATRTGPEPTARRRRRRSPISLLPAYGFVALALLITVVVPFLSIADPYAQDLTATLESGSADHWWGTDDLGRDLFSRVLWGVRTSVLAASTAVVVAIGIGLPLGLLAGYRGGWIDQILSRIADAVLIIPALVLLLAAQSALETGIQGQMVVLGVVFAPRVLRVVRSETIRLRTSPFVIAGRMAGASHTRILARYLMPGVRAQLVVQFSYLLGLALVVESGISFLGVGVQPPDSSLGTLLIGASGLLAVQPHVVLIPACVLTALILSLNLLGDAWAQEREK